MFDAKISARDERGIATVSHTRNRGWQSSLTLEIRPGPDVGHKQSGGEETTTNARSRLGTGTIETTSVATETSKRRVVVIYKSDVRKFR